VTGFEDRLTRVTGVTFDRGDATPAPRTYSCSKCSYPATPGYFTCALCRRKATEVRSKYRDRARAVRPLPDASWMTEAACRNTVPTATFFPERGGRDTAEAAKAVCATCPVSDDCLSWALAVRERGIWGGTTEGEREGIRRRNRRNRRAAGG